MPSYTINHFYVNITWYNFKPCHRRFKSCSTYNATGAAMVSPLEGGEAGGALHAHAGGHVPDPRRGSLPKLILRQLKQRHTNTSLRENMQHSVPHMWLRLGCSVVPVCIELLVIGTFCATYITEISLSSVVEWTCEKIVNSLQGFIKINALR